MFSCDHLSTPFQQDAGTGQNERMPGHLSGSSAPIDGRQVSDLLNYFSGLSGLIKFYNDDGSTSDWSAFFQHHLPFQLSKIDTFTGDQIKSGMQSAVALFNRNPSANGLQLLFLQVYYTAIYPIQQWSVLLPSTQATAIALSKLITERLQSPLQAYISWLNTAVHCWGIQALDLTALSGNTVWGLTPPTLAAYQNNFSCTVPSARRQLLAVQAALSEVVNAFADVVDMTVSGVAGLVNKNLYSLLQNGGKADTPPQLAILYVFLHQFQKVLTDLNGLTGKQLNFFFQQVLSLPPGPSIPDQAYLVFTIQKQLPSYTIDAGTSLKAGKDSAGADIYFQLNSDVVVNQAQVAAVQTVFVNKQSAGGMDYIEGVYMAPNALMADGLSKPFTGTAAWPSVGAKQSLYTPPGAMTPVNYPFARLGFVLASKVLFLQEGKRKIDIQLICQWAQRCSDGVAFNELFSLAQESVCASFVVLTPAILAQASQAGVSAPTIAALTKNLLASGGTVNPCDATSTSLLDQYLWWIPCCTGEGAAGMPAAGATGAVATGTGVTGPDPAERIAAFELEGVKNPVVLDVARRCPDEREETICETAAQQALESMLESIAGKGSTDIPILVELLPLQRLFNVQFSGAKGWQVPDFMDMRLELPAAAGGAGGSAGSGAAAGTSPTFVWHIFATIDSGSPGIGFYDPAKMGEDLQVTDPLVKIELNPAITWTVNEVEGATTTAATTSCLQQPTTTVGQNVSPYEFFRNVALLVSTGDDPVQKTKIDVTVCGVKNLVVQNDANLMDVTKAFTPFGVKPLIPDFELTDSGTVQGSVPGPNFFIGSQEVLLKKWTELYLNMSWLSKPDDFDDYYAGYWPVHFHLLKRNREVYRGLNGNYQVSLSVLENGVWHDRLAGNIPLFPGRLASFPSCCNNDYHDTFKITPEDFNDPVWIYDADFDPLTKWGAGIQRGFLRMTLEEQDFLHKYYPWVMGRAMRFPSEYPNVINDPWTPIIIPGMSIDYKATAHVKDMTLVQLYPFDGTSKVVNIYSTPTLMADFCNEGHLFIGLTGLVPGQNLNLLFEMAEASAGSGSGGGTLTWKYLAGNVWKTLRNGFELSVDGTKGLTRTGILQFNFPDDIDDSSTVLPTGVFWIMAEMTTDTTATSQTMAIIPQACLATYAPVADVNADDRSATPLPAGSITKLKLPDVNVIKVGQPYPSFGGSAPEASGNAYVVRVSEGLRHKGRAIQQWDYERLVLQQFPTLFRVKCINHSYYLDDTGYVYDFPMSPGNILIAVLPDTSKLSVADATQPTVPTSMLGDIATFLQGVKSPFVNITVANPRYEPVTICVTVRFKKNENVQARGAQLEAAIQTFLSPWVGGDLTQFQFAQPLNFADVADLVQQQSYVAHLTKLTISHAGEQATPAQQQGAGAQKGYITPRTPRSILVAGDVFVNAEK